MNTYQIKGYLSNSKKVKTVVVQDVVNSTEAADYAAMFEGIDQIVCINQGKIENGGFVEDRQVYPEKH